ncbi:hypothetical protein ALC62_10589 [Cyphomyrmex costatus]|uniref:Uncharacterized protein n=1 Tax=Cyphomyrmex costatus TaxID=456900 RepID=A0A195CEG7_9HYME|nr:hypothetical protein ALC62_10589 [Cyphomyrmex costatus]
MFKREEKHTTKKLTPRLDFAPKQPLTRDPRQFETCRRVSLFNEGSWRKTAGDGTKRGRQQRGGRGEKEEDGEEEEERRDEEMKRRKRKVEKGAKETQKPGN